MIREKTVTACSELARKIAANGYALGVHPNTTLKNLCQEIGTAMDFASSVSAESFIDESSVGQEHPALTVATAEPEAAIVAASMLTTVSGENTHDQALADTIRRAVKAASFTMDFTRNVVVPRINEGLNQVEEAIMSAANSAGDKIELVPYVWADIFSHPILAESASRFTGQLVVPQIPYLALPTNIGALVQTGSSIFDSAVQEFVKHIGGETSLTAIFQRYLTSDGNSSLQALTRPSVENYNDIVALYLFSISMSAEKPSEYNIDEDDFRLAATALMSFTGNLVGQILSRRKFLANTNTIVLSTSLSNMDGGLRCGQVIVNNDTFSAWVAAGGSENVLRAAIVMNQQTDAASLTAKSAELLRIWKGRVAASEASLRARTQEILVSTTVAYAQGLLRDAEANFLELPAHQINDAIRANASMFLPGEVDKPYNFIRRVILRSLYSHLDCERMLDYIDEVGAGNPDLEAREAVLIALANYVADWFVSQMTVTRV